MQTDKYKILCIDNDISHLSNLSERLVNSGFIALISSRRDFSIDTIKKNNIELIILGIHQFDELNELSLIKQDRSVSDIPVFVYSTINDEYFEITVFKNGAEDFITFPLKMMTLIARIDAFFNRKYKVLNNSIIRANGLEINPNNFCVRFQTGAQIYLPKKDFLLLTFLVDHAGQIFNRNELLNRIWGNDVFIGERTVDVHIRRLREKIGSEYIKTLKGVGYMFPK